ncbi:hypothetical protein [Nocardia ignorata]|uniref:Uncharacterized protein n=1 Tax=Nocardia ignorata TaxID=145285 RepID=A0A4R6P3F0_NOCIG|nr:hypothetical protein [Nocardia ignorata]TDP31480.1 hypothetical protein DFR75_10885 [Nocardia ignorata]
MTHQYRQALRAWRLRQGLLALAVVVAIAGCSREASDEGRHSTVALTTVTPELHSAATDSSCDRYQSDPTADEFITDLANALTLLRASTPDESLEMAQILYNTVDREFQQLRSGAAAEFTIWICEHLPNEETMRAGGVDIEQHRQLVRIGRGNALYAGLSGCASMRTSTSTWTLVNIAASQAEIEDNLRRTLCPR